MKKVIPVIILAAISAFLIFYRFTDIPKFLAYDEVEFTKLALSLENKPYIAYSTLATGHSTLYFYILLASLKTFGINVFALRLPAAIFGVFSVIIFYLIIKRVFQQFNNGAMKQLFPFLLTLILLSSRWFLNFARFSFEATFLLFLELTSIYFLIRLSETSKAKIPNFLRFVVFRQKISVSSFYLIISGLFAGLSFISYTPGRIFFLLPLFFLLFKPIKQLIMKQFNNETIKLILYFTIPFVIIITPLTSYLINNQDSRIDKLFFWKNHEMTINEKVIGTVNNVKSITLMFFTSGDMNGKHNYPGKPAINPILGLLFLIGFIVAMKSIFANLPAGRQGASMDKQWNVLFLIYFLLSIFPSLAIYPWENPNMLRTYTVIPAIVYFVGLAILEILKITKQKYLWLIIIIIAFSSFYELRSYFKYQSTVFYESFEIKLPLDRAIKVKKLL